MGRMHRFGVLVQQKVGIKLGPQLIPILQLHPVLSRLQMKLEGHAILDIMVTIAMVIVLVPVLMTVGGRHVMILSSR